MDTEKENNIRLLLKAQLEQEFGKRCKPEWVEVFIAVSLFCNIIFAFGWYSSYTRLQECAQAAITMLELL